MFRAYTHGLAGIITSSYLARGAVIRTIELVKLAAVGKLLHKQNTG